jgi:hypothetical protein
MNVGLDFDGFSLSVLVCSHMRSVSLDQESRPHAHCPSHREMLGLAFLGSQKIIFPGPAPSQFSKGRRSVLDINVLSEIRTSEKETRV